MKSWAGTYSTMCSEKNDPLFERKASMITVVIHVEGGCVQSVESDKPDEVEVILHDVDADESGDSGIGYMVVDGISDDQIAALREAADEENHVV